MSTFVHAVPLSKKHFDSKDVELSKLYINPLVYPGLYSNLPDGITFDDRKLVDVDIILDSTALFEELDNKFGSNNYQHTQSAAFRAAGRGEKADDVDSSLIDFGFELSHIPISLVRTKDGKYYILDGRTRLAFLISKGFKNIIADVYDLESWAGYFKLGLSRNRPDRARSPMTKSDIISNCLYNVRQGWLNQNDTSAIRQYVIEVTDGNIKKNTLDKIIQAVMKGKGHTSQVISFDETKATKWLNTYGYISNENGNGIYYKAVPASAWSKALSSVCAEVLEIEETGLPFREMRVVIHTGTLDSSDPAQSWMDRIDSFRTGWNKDVSNIENAHFINTKKRSVVKVFGAIPAVVDLKEKYVMDKLVMFHVGPLKNKSFFEISSDDSEDEVIG